MSGADSALMYDTLLEIKDEKQYTKVEGRTYAIGNFSGLSRIIRWFFSNIIPITSSTSSNIYFIFMYPNSC